MHPSRAFITVLVAAMLLHGAILLWAVGGALNTLPEENAALETSAVAAVSIISFWILLKLWPALIRRIAAASGVLLACALTTPGAVVVVALMLFNSQLLGMRLIAWIRGDGVAEDTLPASVSTLVGISVWSGVMAITAATKVHYAPVYVAALLVPLFAWSHQTRALADALWRALIRPTTATGTERVWISVTLTLVVLHLFVVAKPEVGYDANNVHLQFARLFAEYHRWRFDVTRYAWAVMPLGADYAYAAAYILGGEHAARLINLCFAVLCSDITYRLILRYARPQIALLSVCLLASTPLAFLETGTLYVENLWIAFLLGGLLLVFDYASSRSPAALAAFALLCAGAMQTKLIGVIWIAPLTLCVAYLWARHGRDAGNIRRRLAAVIAAAVVIAAWPYANAWIRTGNPVFPFMNAVFRSAYFDASSSFTNPRYVMPLRPSSIYDVFVASSRFIEGRDGAAGFHWLLLLPLIILAFMRRRPAPQWLCLALAAAFFAVVHAQQAYLRYELPALFLITILGGWALSDLTWTRATRVGVLAVGGLLCVLNLQFLVAASWTNATLCLTCSQDSDARAEYIATYLPDRAVAAYLTANLPTARVAFFTVNAAGASGYVGYSRAANWHDAEVYPALLNARTAEDVLALCRRYQLTHAVFRDPADSDDAAVPALVAFRLKYTSPVWRYRNMLVSEIKPDT